MTPTPILLAGHRLMLDPAGGLFWPDAGVLVVSDLHLEKGSAAAQRGQLVPPWDTRLTLDRLAALLHRWQPRQVVALGDSFHDRRGSLRMLPGDARALAAMAAAVPFVWVLGNHDPEPPAGIPGTAAAEFALQGLQFRHQASRQASAPSELSGHYHPKATIFTRAGYVTRPCFMTSGTRIVLPSLGAYTGGLDVENPAIATLFPGGGRAFLLGRDRLFAFTLGPAASCRNNDERQRPATPTPALP